MPFSPFSFVKAMKRAMRLNRYAFHIRYIGRDECQTLKSVLRTVGKAALNAEQRISDVAQSHDAEYLAELGAEETILIEDLLGCAFVAAQSYVTRITARIEWLHKRLERDGHRLTTTDGKKSALIDAFSDTLPSTTHTQIRVIWELANYFKHHEEWPPNWDKTDKKSKRTVAVVRAIGAAPNSSDNCRKGLVALGIHCPFDVYTIATIVADWHAKLADAYKNELKPLGQS